MFSKKRNPKVLFLYTLLTTYFFTISGSFFYTTHANIVTPTEIPNIVFHYDAQDTDGDGNPANEPNNNATLSTWVDKENAYNATQATNNMKPRYRASSINGMPSVDFDGNNDFYDIANQGPINTNSIFTEKSLAIVFKSGNDVTSFQTIYEQGGGLRGYSFVIENDHIYAGVWNNTEWDEGHDYKSVDLGVIQPNTVYFILIVQDSDNGNDQDNKLSIYINGNLASFQDHVDPQYAHGGAIGFGRVDGNARKASDNTNSSGPAYLNGEVGEFVSWNHALTYNEIQGLQNYFSDRWGVVALGEVQRVEVLTTDTTPEYVFSTNGTGTLSYAGGCDSTTTTAVLGDNTINFDSDGAGAPLAVGDYNDCVITLTTDGGSESTLNVSSFSVVENTTGTGIILPSSIANLIFHYNAQNTDGDGNPLNEPSNGSTVTTWTDIANGYNATQAISTQRGTYLTGSINGMPSIEFDGIDDVYDIASQANIDGNTFTQKSFATVFKTGDDVSTFQVIYEQGTTTRGYNVTVDNGRVYAGIWNTSWDVGHRYKSVDMGVVLPDTVYFMVLIQDSQTINDEQNRLYIFLNGNLISFQEHVDAQQTHTSNIGLGGKRNGTLRPSDNTPTAGDGDYFKGHIGEMMSWNHALTYSEVQGIQNYFLNVWAIVLFYETLPVTSPTTNQNPSYEFYTDTPGTLSYAGSCNSQENGASIGNNTIIFDSDGMGGAMGTGTYSDCSIMLNTGVSTVSLVVTPFTIEEAFYSLTEVTPVPTPTDDTTPNYTFSSPIAGTISYLGSCSSATTNATIGNNTITFNTLTSGTYNDCAIRVINGLEVTGYLNVSEFTISTDFISPTITSSSPNTDSLFPIDGISITFEYEDDPSGEGIDTFASDTILQKWDGVSAYGPDISTTNITIQTQTATGASYTTSGLNFGKYQFTFEVFDNVGNSVTEQIVFYIDEIGLTISTGSIDIGDLSAESITFSPELNITVETVGAAFDLLMNKTQILTSTFGDEILDWDSAKGFGYDQEVYSGSPTAISTNTVIASQATSLNTNGNKNSYIYRIKYGALIEEQQMPGDYQTFINFTLHTTY